MARHFVELQSALVWWFSLHLGYICTNWFADASCAFFLFLSCFPISIIGRGHGDNPQTPRGDGGFSPFFLVVSKANPPSYNPPPWAQPPNRDVSALEGKLKEQKVTMCRKSHGVPKKTAVVGMPMSEVLAKPHKIAQNAHIVCPLVQKWGAPFDLFCLYTKP